MIEFELEDDVTTQIHQINAVAELKRVKFWKPPQSWGGQMSAEITWELCENLRFTARTGFTTVLVNQVSYIGDALILTFEYAPLHPAPEALDAAQVVDQVLARDDVLLARQDHHQVGLVGQGRGAAQVAGAHRCATEERVMTIGCCGRSASAARRVARPSGHARRDPDVGCALQRAGGVARMPP